MSEQVLAVNPNTAELPSSEPAVAVTTSSSGKTRKALVPPKNVTPDMNLLDYLRNCTPPADQKIIDIVCFQNDIPQKLKEDAAQEIRVVWFMNFPDYATFQPGQIASYAHRVAGHAALRLRREVGSAVRLPGSAFRKRKDGTSYVTPGVLAPALDWDKLDGWMQTGDGDGEGPSMPEGFADELGLNPLLANSDPNDPEPIVEEDEADVNRRVRLEVLEKKREDLTPRQFNIIEALIHGDTYDEIMKAEEIKRGVLLREVGIAATVLGDAFMNG